MNHIRKAIITAAMTTAAVSSHAESITLDGVLSSTNEYSHVYNVDFNVDDQGVSYNGVVRLGQGSNADGTTGGSNDIFMLVEVPTELTDLTFGVNTAPGWAGTGDANEFGEMEYGKVTGSEKLGFDLGGEAVEIKMKDDGNGNGFEIRDDGKGALLAASTSLHNNLALFGSAYTVDSPECGSTLGAPTSDADCYANPIFGAEDYEFAQIYEMQFDGSLFTLAELGDFLTLMSASYSHASPAKNLGKLTFTMGCIDSNDCNRVSAVPAPAPATLGLVSIVLAGLGLRKKVRAA